MIERIYNLHDNNEQMLPSADAALRVQSDVCSSGEVFLGSWPDVLAAP